MGLEVKIGKLTLKNPVVLASGTFDINITQKIDASKLGAITTKTITLEPREGNPLPHIVKAKYGYLNSVGLKNPGIKEYLREELPFWKKFNTQIITSIGGNSVDEYIKLINILEKSWIETVEINVSCPNVEHGVAIGTDERLLSDLIKALRKLFSGTLLVKLSPNVTDITKIAKVAMGAKADGLTMTNTFLGMTIDNKAKKPLFHRVTGGYSGPAIKPLALRAVWEVYTKLKCPIVGGGGIENFDDALDFVMCGAGAVFVGSANFSNPQASVEIVTGFKKYFKENKIEDLSEIRGII